MPSRIVVTGVGGDSSGCGAVVGGTLVPEEVDLVVGGRRHLEALAPAGARTVVIDGDVESALDQVAAEPGTVCVLASGDPGFFGIVRPLAARFGPERLEVRPVASSISLAFARLGLPWDDAAVVSAHGRPLREAAFAACRRPKVAVLVSPESPPEALGKELLAAGARHRRVAVCSRLGDAGEQVRLTDLAGLAAGTWDPLSVVLLLPHDGVAGRRSLAWGLPDDHFVHRAGMITRSDVRAVVLGKLDLPERGVLWDVGAGSASVSVECARLSPGLAAFAVERRADDAERARQNTVAHDVLVHVIEGEAPAVLDGLPDPDRAFVGGGGLSVLDSVLARLRPGGRAVATYAAMDRAVAAMDRLGSMVQLGVARAERLPDGGTRLAAENPVFVAWGPER